MNALSEKESLLINSVLEQHPEVSLVKLFGSRAKGCHTNASDIDLALWGVDALQAEAIASELDELPLPYRFDVKAFESIKQESLREHILRKGIDWNRTSPASVGSDVLYNAHRSPSFKKFLSPLAFWSSHHIVKTWNSRSPILKLSASR